MAVYFKSEDSTALLKAFNDRVSQSEQKGKITTWKKSSDNIHFTHKAKDWTGKAFFKPTVDAGRLRFNIIKNQSENIGTFTYAYYHGHLIETFLSHFDGMFSEATATAMPATGDVVGKS